MNELWKNKIKREYFKDIYEDTSGRTWQKI